MSGTPYLLKATAEDMARWKATAKARGVSFAVHVRTALDAAEGKRPRKRSSTRQKGVSSTRHD